MKRLCLLFLFVLSMLGARSQGAPELRCIEVDEDTNVILHWIPPDDPGNNFHEYKIGVTKDSSGTFTETNVPGLGTDTDTNFNADLISGTEFYYVTAVYDDGTGSQEFTSETLSVIVPSISGATDTTATVEWNRQIAPNLPSNSGEYEVFRRFGTAGPWTLIGTRNYGDEEYFDDSFKVCKQIIQYKIETEDNSGCRSVSRISGREFVDSYPPDIPDIDSITIDTATGNIYLSWSEVDAPDTWGYQILFWDQGWIVIDSVFGKDNTTFIDSLASGSDQAQRYTITAFDSCLRGNPPTANVSPGALPAHQSIFVAAEPDFCEAEVQLEWDQYLGWDDIEEYEIYYNINDGPFVLLTTVSHEDSTYLHEDVDIRQDLCYVLVATKENRSHTTTSNMACPTGAGSFTPAVHYLNYTTVVDEGLVRAESTVDSTVQANYYTLERAVDSAGTFLEVDRIDFDGSSRLSFEDESARPGQTDYWYKVVMYDSCEFPAVTSNVSKTVYLKGEMDRQTYINQLEWTPYIGWGGLEADRFDRYEVLRVSGYADENPEIAETAFEGTLSFEESAEDVMEEGKETCYRIRAVNELEAKSYSNMVCPGDNTRIFIPNAFYPDGQHNKEFKPVISFGDLTQYEMIIFDRYGHVVFESNDIETGWNGENKGGNFAKPGVYIYKISVGNQTGDEEVRHGKVTLIR